MVFHKQNLKQYKFTNPSLWGFWEAKCGLYTEYVVDATFFCLGFFLFLTFSPMLLGIFKIIIKLPMILISDKLE